MHLTTRRSVIVGLLIVQALSLLALFFVSGRIAAEAEAEHQDALLSTESAEAVDRMRAHIQPAESIAQFTSNVLADPTVRPEALLGSFRESMEASPQLDGVFVGLPNGEFMYLSREDDGYVLKEIDVDESGRRTVLVTLDADGNELSRRDDPLDEYNPTQRPWYQLASANPGEVSWTDPYVFFTSRQLGISSASPILRDGELVGVVGADIELGSLSSFLTSLNAGTNGGSIITNQDGVVIAHPEPEKIQRADGDSFTTVAISELEDELARSAIASFVEEGSRAETTLTSFETSDFGASQGSFRRVPVGGEDTWIVGVFGPEDSLVSGLASARAAERSLLVVAGFVGLLLAAAVFTRATKSIDDLEEHAWSDALTGLPNRRKILRAVDKHVTEGDESDSVAMLDVDNFKRVNDTYGHQVGDEVLTEVANRAKQALPPGCSIGRIGGEEFLVLMPGFGSSDARDVCENIRKAVRASPVQHAAGALEVTVSLGLATSTGPTTRSQLMAVADTALLEAKSSGRDKVVAGDGLRIVGELDVG